MKKKKLPAILMAAALAVTTAGQTAGVLAAEFTDAETYVSAEPEEAASGQASYAGDAEGAAQWEDAEIFSADEWTADAGSADAGTENAAETGNAGPEEAVQEPDEELEIPDAEEDIFQEEEQGEELPDGQTFEDEIQPEETFSDDVTAEEFEDGEDAELLEASAGTATYFGAYVTKTEFEKWKNDGEIPEIFTKWLDNDKASDMGVTTVKAATPAGFISRVSGTKTGYLLMGTEADTQNGYSDYVVPSGLTVGVMGYEYSDENDCPWERPFVNSITPVGNIVLRGEIETPGNLVLKEGKGTVTMANCGVAGGIVGNGSNDTIILDGFSVDANGLKGVENIAISEGFEALNIRGGSSEFYNITNNHKNCENGYAMTINVMREYKASAVPVFHKKIDLGTTKDPEEGEIEGYLTVRYCDDEDGDMETFTLKPGQQAVKFDLASDGDILDMLDRVLVDTSDSGPFRADIDGTFYDNHDWESVFHISRIREAGGMTEEQILDHYAVDDVNPEEAFVEIYGSRTFGNAVRIMNADQKKGKGPEGRGSGYFRVYMPENYKIEGTLTVPDAAKGIVYDLSGKTSVSSIQVPKGKRLRVNGLMTSSGTLEITGEGMTEIIHGRLNQNVTAENLTLFDCSVKSLTCNNLISTDTNLAVGTSLKIKKAFLGGASILAKSGSVIDMGEINTEGADVGYIGFLCEVNNGKTGTIKASGNIKLGTVKDDNGKVLGKAFITLMYYDYTKAAKAGAPCAKNIFDESFGLWAEEESLNPRAFIVSYDGKAAGLLSLSGNAAKNFKAEPGMFLFDYANMTLVSGSNPALPNGRYLMANMENGKEVSAYIQTDIKTGAISISKAVVSAIKNQTYTGKALKPAVTVKLGTRTLKSGTDYTVGYSNNTKAGTATVKITGKGNYTGTITKTFKIVYAVPKKGAKATVGTLQYQVTKSASKNGTVSVIAPKSKTSTSITIPATVKINGYTFNVTAIGAGAFKDCTKLAKVTIGSKVTSIGAQAFYGCKSLKTITVGTSVLKSVGKNALYGINAKATVSVSYAKLSAYKKLFAGKGQSKTVTVANPVPAKGKTAQVGTLKYKITKSASKNGTVTVTAPVKKTYTSITIPSTVKIEGYNFKVTAVSASAFKNNTKLAKVTLGANLTTIGKEVFYGCKALKTITVQTKNLKTVGSDALKGIYKKAVVKVPSAKLTAYKKLFKGKGQSATVKISK
ncbi:MAG: leucine-rich repeat protein [Eubacteriales bacterium]|nr:leucine-rich repeat protein [Eubacteriales bacterium]